MTTPSKNTNNTHDFFKSIWHRGNYPVLNNCNNTIDWRTSQDLKNLQCNELIEHFVDRVAKSLEYAFDFERTFYETRLKKQTQIGNLFYKLLALQNVHFNPDMNSMMFRVETIRYEYYEISENARVLMDTVISLNLHKARFSGDPLLIINADGLLEGELINTLVIRLREAIKQKKFKTRFSERKKEATQRIKHIKNYIKRLCDNYPDLWYQELFFFYRINDFGIPSVGLAESNVHFSKILTVIHSNSSICWDNPVGWWWKREYLTEIGYYYNVSLIFKGPIEHYDLNAMERDFSYQWHEMTNNLGGCIVVQSTQIQKKHFNNGLDVFLAIFQNRFMGDVYLRLKPFAKYENFGKGVLPKLMVQSPVVLRKVS